MSKDIISKKTRLEFREYLVGWVLREIQNEFDAADIVCDHDFDPPESGARRRLVEQYYHTLDFKDWNDIRKLLTAYENILCSADEVLPDAVMPLNKWLRKDGFEYANGKISVLQSHAARISDVRNVASTYDAGHMEDQIKRIEQSLESDPALALGSSKELLETCCKTILNENRVEFTNSTDMPDLLKLTLKELSLVPDSIPESAKGAQIIKRMLSNLGQITHGIVEIRNLYGTGHGKDGAARGLQPRHAKLAVGATATLVVFLFETHRERNGS